MSRMNIEIDLQKYESLLNTARTMWFSYKKTVRFCGGEKRVSRLIDEGRLRFEKNEGAPNSMWKFNAADVFSNPKPLIKGSKIANVKNP